MKTESDVNTPTLLNDIVFKMVFGTEANRPLLRALLNALLSLSGAERIVELEILNPQLGKEYSTQKDGILDVKARDSRGQLYNVEVQVTDRPAYVERVLYYLARLFSSQLEKGDPYTRIARTIGISLLDFELFPDMPDLHSTYRFHDEKHGRTLTDVLELHFIELSKFRRDRPRELASPFEKWLHVLKFGGLYESDRVALPAELQEEEGIEMALNVWRKASASRQVREILELREKADHDAATAREHDRMQMEQGRLRMEQELKQMEQGRLRMEHDRMQMEQGRLRMEHDRMQMEQERLKVEQELKHLEQELKHLEQERLKMEQELRQSREQTLQQGQRDARMQIARQMRDSGMTAEEIRRTTGLELDDL